MKNTKTWVPKPEDIEKKWWIVDAKGQTLGRLASQIAQVLRGKNKASFTPNTDVGDFVVVVNADQVKLSGNKTTEKTYYRHSRFFGSLKSFSAEELLKDDPVYMFQEAVKGMLPKTRLGRTLLTKLKTYKGPEHPHAAQKPETLNVN